MPDMSEVSIDSQRVRYPRGELLALREQAVANSPAFWNRVLEDLGPVAQEICELDVEQTAVTPPRKRNVDRRDRGSDKLAYRHSTVDSPGVIWCGKKDFENELSYEPVACGTKLENLVHSDVEHVEEDDVYADSDSDDESFQPRAFVVQGEPDFESGPPQDGWEYLRRVRWEAAQCPKVKVARIDPKKFASAQTPYMPEIPAVQQCAPELLPSAEWEREFLADFSDLRLRLAGVRVPSGVVETSLPPVKNKAAWQRLCFGTIPLRTGSDDDPHMVDEDPQLVEDEARGMGGDEVDETTETISNPEVLNGSQYQEEEGTRSNLDLEDVKVNEGASDHVEEHMAEEGEENLAMKDEMGNKDMQGKPQNDEAAVDDSEASVPYIEHAAQLLTSEDGEQSSNSCVADSRCKDSSCSPPNLVLDQEAREGTHDVSGPGSPISQDLKQLQLPVLAVLIRLDEVSRAALLRDQVSWLEAVPGLPQERAVWLFALAAAVDKPLDAETSASFRSLFRRCAEIRASKTNDDEELVMLNILMTIAGRYFGQAEEMVPR